MTTYTSQEIAQLLKGSIRINEERATIVRFFQMIVPFIHSEQAPWTEVPGFTFRVYRNQDTLGNLQVLWEKNGSVRVWYHRGSPTINSISILGGEADHLRKEEVIGIYDILPTVLNALARFCLGLPAALQFFLDAAKRQ